MAFSASTITNVGGAVSDVFAGIGAKQSADLKAAGLDLQASGLRIKAAGDLAEADQYDLATALAYKNEQYVVDSTIIQQKQLDRQIYQTIGAQVAAESGAGIKTNFDLLADSAAQGFLAKDVLAKQSLITEAGYDEQAKSYAVMSAAARATAQGETGIAAQTNILAEETRSAGKTAEMGDFVSAAFKGAAAVAGVLLAPETGGLSLAVTAAAAAPTATGGIY